MNLDFLLGEVGIKSNFGDVEITSVTERIEKVKEGSLFVAVQGNNFDGNAFITEALSKGAAAVITEKDIKADNVIKVNCARTMLSFLCSALYSYPQYKMKMIGITGTNGKTTTAQYLKHILLSAGKKCAVIGTLGIDSDEMSVSTGYTTPSPEVLFRELNDLVGRGYEYCILEVSSQALAQARVDPIEFELAVFTNIGRDHTDYHGSIEKYVAAKAKLFTLSKNSLINTDDAYAEIFENHSSGKVLLYSAKDKAADYMAKNIRFSENGFSYIALKNDAVERFNTNGLGEFTVYNTLAAIAAADVLEIEFEKAVSSLSLLPEVKGRLQKIDCIEKNVYIDFAHTPEALEAVLKTMRSHTKAKLICVFGCGGNRDRSKRSIMGRIAENYCDEIVLTSDNSRDESPDAIMTDISNGIKNKKNIIKEKDRKKAIELALRIAGNEDVVLVAGKGHEEYQLTNGTKEYFSDVLTVKTLLGLI